MYATKVYITPEDILDRLSPEEKEKFNQCVFTNIVREQDGSITIEAVLFHDDDPYVIAKHREKYFGEKHEISQEAHCNRGIFPWS